MRRNATASGSAGLQVDTFIRISLLQSGAIKPIVAKISPLPEAADALRYLVEGRPFGRVVLTT